MSSSSNTNGVATAAAWAALDIVDSQAAAVAAAAVGQASAAAVGPRPFGNQKSIS